LKIEERKDLVEILTGKAERLGSKVEFISC